MMDSVVEIANVDAGGLHLPGLVPQLKAPGLSTRPGAIQDERQRTA